MPKFAANLSYLWTELPFLARFECAARAGFRGVEYHFPYDVPSATIRARLQEFGLTAVLHNLAPGDLAQGEFGLAGIPGREAAFRESVAQALDYAVDLDTARCNCLAGRLPAGVPRQACIDTLVGNLQFAGDAFAKAGRMLTVEPLNAFDQPEFLLHTSAATLDVLAQVGLDNVKLQVDFYHMARMGDDLAGTVQTHLAAIGHVQFADAPGRNEPGTGSIDLHALFQHLDQIGYDGWVSAEYRPSTDTDASLDWLQRYLPTSNPGG